MKNILLLVHDDAGQEARLQAALDLTRALDGHLICLDVVQLPVMSGNYMYSEGQALLLDDERVRESANRERLTERLGREGISWEMSQLSGDISGCVTRAAGLADLIVMNRKLEERTSVNMLAEATAVIMSSRKPVVAVSDTARGFDVFGRALIAWNGSEPAMAAVRHSIPLLRLAKQVELVEIEESGVDSSVEEAAAYLSRHDIHPIIHQMKLGGRYAAEVIEEACTRDWIAYCVMGAYGHSRLREALIGGVTRHMLSKSRVPLILAH